MSDAPDPRAARLEKLLAFHAAAPGDDFAPYAIAQEHLRAGDDGEGLRWLAKTLELNADHAYAWYHRAAVLARRGRAGEARGAIEAGLAAAGRSGDGKAAGELRELAGTLEPPG